MCIIRRIPWWGRCGNCGDWVETMSAVVEYGDGRMETLLYKDFMKRLAYGKCGTGAGAEASSCKEAS